MAVSMRRPQRAHPARRVARMSHVGDERTQTESILEANRAEVVALLDGLTDNPMLLPGVGALALLLGGFAFWRLRGRRKMASETSFLESRMQPDSFFGASGGQRVDTTTSSSQMSGQSMQYSPSQLDAGDVDPLAIQRQMIIIGDTMGSYDKDVFPRAWAWKSVTDLTKEIASTKTTCVWVGPAYGTEGGSYFKNQKRTEELSKFFSQNVAPCGYIDSLKFSKPGEWRTLDGQHYAPAGYKLWSAAITKALIEMPMVQQLRKK